MLAQCVAGVAIAVVAVEIRLKKIVPACWQATRFTARCTAKQKSVQGLSHGSSAITELVAARLTFYYPRSGAASGEWELEAFVIDIVSRTRFFARIHLQIASETRPGRHHRQQNHSITSIFVGTLIYDVHVVPPKPER